MATTSWSRAPTSMSSTTPVAVVDLLNSLLEAEMNSAFRFMGEGSPYLSRATIEVRRPLQEMMLAEHRRAGELADLIESLGSVPTPQVGIRREEQFLAYLSLKFLLPKLVEEKKLQIQRYDNALRGAKSLPQVPGEVPAIINAHLAQLREELTSLEQAAAHVAAGRAADAAAAAATPPGKDGQKDPSRPAGATKKHSDAGPSGG